MFVELESGEKIELALTLKGMRIFEECSGKNFEKEKAEIIKRFTALKDATQEELIDAAYDYELLDRVAGMLAAMYRKDGEQSAATYEEALNSDWVLTLGGVAAVNIIIQESVKNAKWLENMTHGKKKESAA